MPFSGPDDPTLPERIQDMPEDVRDKWAKTWNAAFDRCENESGEDCEGVAFRIANSAIEDEADNSMMETIKDFLQVKLAALVDGKPFDGFTHTHGDEFVDMRGQEIKIEKSELKTYVKNTKAKILSASTDGGEIVGLPIDSLNHDRGDAAGFIIDVELSDGGDVVRFIPQWTELGLEKIGKGLQRFFSPTFNVVQKVIMGGSLTNHPASLDKNGNVLLRPIELSQGFYVVEAAKPETLEVTGGAATTTVTGTVDGHEVTVTSEGTLLPPKNLPNLSIESQAKENDESGDTEMGMSKDELAEFIRTEVGTAIGTAVKDAMPKVSGQEGEGSKPVSPAFDILDMLDLSEVQEEAVREFKDNFLLQAEQYRETAKREAMQTIALMRREQDIVEFAQRITNGTDDHPVGIPSTEDEVKKFLMSLKPEQAKKAIEILSAIQETGLTEFVEKGHSKRLTGTAKLESPISETLSAWVKEGGKISEFFKMNASELGDMEQYNLSEFKEKVKE